MEHYDPLADDTRLFDEEPQYLPSSTPEFRPHEKYILDQYQWEGFCPDYVVVPLSKGYFTLVEEEDMGKINLLTCVYANTSLCPRTGEIVKVRAIGQIGSKKFYLHRYLAGAGTHEVVDHFNRHPLDNRRRRNLRRIGQGINLTNTGRKSRSGLLRGVQRMGNKFRGQIGYHRTNLQSKVLDTEQEAHEWYLAKRKELYGSAENETGPLVLDYPVLPPLLPKFHPVVINHAVDTIGATF